MNRVPDCVPTTSPLPGEGRRTLLEAVWEAEAAFNEAVYDYNAAVDVVEEAWLRLDEALDATYALPGDPDSEEPLDFDVPEYLDGVELGHAHFGRALLEEELQAAVGDQDWGTVAQLASLLKRTGDTSPPGDGPHAG